MKIAAAAFVCLTVPIVQLCRADAAVPSWLLVSQRDIGGLPLVGTGGGVGYRARLYRVTLRNGRLTVFPCLVAPLWSRNRMYCVGAADAGRFLVLTETRRPTIFDCTARGHSGAISWRIRRICRLNLPLVYNAITPPFAIGPRGDCWICSLQLPKLPRGTSPPRVLVRVYGPRLRKRIGRLELARGEVFSEMAFTAKRCVLVTGRAFGTGGKKSPEQYNIRLLGPRARVISEKLLHGAWPPRYLSVFGSRLSGIDAQRRLMWINVGRNRIGRVHYRNIRVVRGKIARDAPIGPYVATGPDSGLCVVPIAAPHGPRYELASISLETGAVVRSRPLGRHGRPFAFLRLGNGVLVRFDHGGIGIYNKKLMLVAYTPPIGPNPAGMAISCSVASGP